MKYFNNRLNRQVEIKTTEQLVASTIEKKTRIMLKNINNNFIDFAQTPIYQQFLVSLYEYAKDFAKLDQKKKNLEDQTKFISSMIYQPLLLKSEIEQIEKKLQSVSELYCKILLQKMDIKSKQWTFFETFIYFSINILKELTDEESFPVIQTEVNRLFRSNLGNKQATKAIRLRSPLISSLLPSIQDKFFYLLYYNQQHQEKLLELTNKYKIQTSLSQILHKYFVQQNKMKFSRLSKSFNQKV